MWQVYLVLCNDGTLYCGISRDINVRLEEHNRGNGAKYTRARRPVRLVWFLDGINNRSDATKLELQVKKLTRSQKWALIRRTVY